MTRQRFSKWLRWLFRRGQRSSLLLNIDPGDRIVSMIVYRQYLTVATAFGEIYMIDGDRLVEFRQAEIKKVASIGNMR